MWTTLFLAHIICMMERSSNYSSVGNDHKPNSSNFTILTSSCYIFKYINEKLKITGVGVGVGNGGDDDVNFCLGCLVIVL